MNPMDRDPSQGADLEEIRAKMIGRRVESIDIHPAVEGGLIFGLADSEGPVGSKDNRTQMILGFTELGFWVEKDQPMIRTPLIREMP